MKSSINAYMHFSIDDVIDCFRWIHDTEPKSIFEEPMLSQLRIWHELYGVCFDCYVFEEKNEFTLESMQDLYWEELRRNAAWLRLGWHQIRPGDIMEEVSKQIDSAIRVTELIKRKCGLQGCSWVVRLHNFAGDARLVEELHKLGVKAFLTSDKKNAVSYDLTDKQCAALEKSGYYLDRGRGIAYKRTSICLDNLSIHHSPEDTLADIYDAVNIQPMKLSVELCCHEHVFSDISAGVDEVIKKIHSVRKRAYLNATVNCRGGVFFTDIYSTLLYRMDVTTKEIDALADLDIKGGGRKFASMVLQDDSHIWMVPWDSDKLLIYDIENKIITTVILDNYSLDLRRTGFRKCVVYHNNLWLLPTKGEILLCIDMKKKSFIEIKGFPSEVLFDKGKEMMFKCMDLYGGFVYLFSDGCSHNLKIDIHTGQISVWNNDFNGCFGIMVDQDTALLSPTYKGEPLRLYKDGLLKKIELPTDIWQDIQYYAFWYASRVGDDIYIMPHEAKAVIRYSCEKQTADIIRYPGVDFFTLRTNQGFSGYDALVTRDGVWLAAYMGNHFLHLGERGEVEETINVDIPLDVFYEHNFDSSYLKRMHVENTIYKLDGLIRDLPRTVEYREITLNKQNGEVFFEKN